MRRAVSVCVCLAQWEHKDILSADIGQRGNLFSLPTFEVVAVGNVSSVGSWRGGMADLPPGQIVSISGLPWVAGRALPPFLWG